MVYGVGGDGGWLKRQGQAGGDGEGEGEFCMQCHKVGNSERGQSDCLCKSQQPLNGAFSEDDIP